MDYVLRPNYHFNSGSDDIFDSLDGLTVEPYQKAFLSRSICEMYDNLEQMDVAYEIADLKSQQASDAQNALDRELGLKKRRVERAKANKEANFRHEKELQASMLLDSIPFDTAISESNGFLNATVVKDDDLKDDVKKITMAERNANALSKFF